MRTFLAIDIPEKIQIEISQQLQSLQEEYPQLNWVPFENYHITLFFLDGKTDGELKQIISEIDKGLFDIPLFHLYPHNLDLFINEKIDLYVSFQREKILETMVERLRSSLLYEPKQKFVPHLTIAKHKIPSKQQYFVLKKKLNNTIIDFDLPVKKIYLYKTITKDNKSSYKKIAAFPLLRER